MELRVLSSMAKVFSGGIDARYTDQPRVYICQGEAAFVQLAFRETEGISRDIRVHVQGCDGVSLYDVKEVPVVVPTGTQNDNDYLSLTPGLYPDLLYPLDVAGNSSVTRQWKSILVKVEKLPIGRHSLTACFTEIDGSPIASKCITINVSASSLAPQRLKYTRWFHTDALARTYGFPVFSEAYWTCVEAFLTAARLQGMNMVLTPIHTPPLDTDIGAERLTVQLVDITVLADGKYDFAFDNLDRWVAMCKRVGIEYYEMAHLYTQWGAKAAPKIVGHVPGGENKRIFGWETPADSPAYADFLRQYLTALTAHLEELGITAQCVFHISDEPHGTQADAYRIARTQVAPYLEGFTIMDALSDVELYRSGTVTMPVPANNHATAFDAEDIPERWTYYCCGQQEQVSNCFIAMPGERTRILGVQLYRKGYTGFLQWGLNFYFSEHSRRLINPYMVTDGGRAWPAGDPFNLYPGMDEKPLESLRSMLMRQAVEDYRALDALEKKIGREKVCALIDELAGEELTFESYPRNENFLLKLRKKMAEQM